MTIDAAVLVGLFLKYVVKSNGLMSTNIVDYVSLEALVIRGWLYTSMEKES